MLLLTSVDTDVEANELAHRFEASGIPVFIEPDYTRTDPSNRNSTFGYRVHLWLEEQVEEAEQLLRDPAYEVVSPVDVQAFYSTLRKHDERKEGEWREAETRWLNWIVGALALGFVGWVAYGALRS